MKHPKMALLGVGVGFGQFSYEKIGDTLLVTPLCLHHSVENSFQLLLSTFRGTPKYKNIVTLKTIIRRTMFYLDVQKFSNKKYVHSLKKLRNNSPDRAEKEHK